MRQSNSLIVDVLPNSINVLWKKIESHSKNVGKLSLRQSKIEEWFLKGKSTFGVVASSKYSKEQRRLENFQCKRKETQSPKWWNTLYTLLVRGECTHIHWMRWRVFQLRKHYINKSSFAPWKNYYQGTFSSFSFGSFKKMSHEKSYHSQQIIYTLISMLRWNGMYVQPHLPLHSTPVLDSSTVQILILLLTWGRPRYTNLSLPKSSLALNRRFDRFQHTPTHINWALQKGSNNAVL